MNNNWIYIILFITVSCNDKIRSYPDTPIIKLNQFNYIDTSLVISFIDGYGNFGFSSSDTLSLSDTTDSVYNVFTPMEKKVNGVYIPVGSVSNWRYRITDVPQPQGQNKTQKGEIKLRFYWMSKELFPDTFRFKFWIVDNAYNKSNVDSTSDLFKIKIGLP